MPEPRYVCTHCQEALTRCRCELDVLQHLLRLLLVPEGYGPECEDAVAALVGDAHG